MMHRKPIRSPRGPKRIVKKVVEDIQTKHIQGISDTEVKFKKKKTPIVRHVSQAAQTIVSNINIVEGIQFFRIFIVTHFVHEC